MSLIFTHWKFCWEQQDRALLINIFSEPEASGSETEKSCHVQDPSLVSLPCFCWFCFWGFFFAALWNLCAGTDCLCALPLPSPQPRRQAPGGVCSGLSAEHPMQTPDRRNSTGKLRKTSKKKKYLGKTLVSIHNAWSEQNSFKVINLFGKCCHIYIQLNRKVDIPLPIKPLKFTLAINRIYTNLTLT